MEIVNGYELVNSIYTFLLAIKNNSKIDYNKITSRVTMKETKQHYTEAKLVQLLEEKGIGRPSTFSSLIDKIQSRGYVKKENVTGKTVKCVDFDLTGDILNEINTEREFGNEKNKLVIQPIGLIVCEFLTKYYNDLFKYEYTKYMEDVLDNIAKGFTVWHELCRECLNQVETSTSQIDLTGKISIHTDEADDVDGGEKKEKKFVSKKLGKYDNETLTLKKGKYGLYVTWGENKKSLNGLDKEVSEITLDDVITHINRPITTLNQDTHTQKSESSNIVKYINYDLSIRKGKYGDYIFYKTKSMRTPKFFSLSKYNGNYKTDDISTILRWIKENYNV